MSAAVPFELDPELLRGKVAVITGASRGLGAGSPNASPRTAWSWGCALAGSRRRRRVSGRSPERSMSPTRSGSSSSPTPSSSASAPSTSGSTTPACSTRSAPSGTSTRLRSIGRWPSTSAASSTGRVCSPHWLGCSRTGPACSSTCRRAPHVDLRGLVDLRRDEGSRRSVHADHRGRGAWAALLRRLTRSRRHRDAGEDPGHEQEEVPGGRTVPDGARPRRVELTRLGG